MSQSVRAISAVLGYQPPLVVKHINDHHQFGKDNRALEAPAEIEPLTPEIEAELDRLTQADLALYEHAKRRFAEMRPSLFSMFSTLRMAMPRRRRATTP